ncbi:prealbumin-like fold domain-containing protein [Marinobacterium rhizophilum]|uniref:prealbumin-like fold domain-containing protein n=1 Tax=Marinobacterium rhizophilum TaxID=420402 RepID=UPI00036AA020|nr:hypothetical protein [Marinobacterium rhizophilum]
MKFFTSRCKTLLFRVTSFLTLTMPLVFILALVPGVQTYAFDTVPVPFLELDADIVDDDPPEPDDDWNTLAGETVNGNLPGTPGPNLITTTGRLQDPDSPTTSYFSTGSSKDIQDLSEWDTTGNSAPHKDEILNAGAAAYRGPTGDLLIGFFLDRYADRGTATGGFWFTVEDAYDPVTGDFIGNHTVGDILVIADFTQGGAVGTVRILEWVGDNNGQDDSLIVPAPGGGNGPLQLLFEEGSFSGGAAGTLACNAANTVCAISNGVDTTTAWDDFDPKHGPLGTYPSGSLFEGMINVSELLPGDDPCISGFIAETRASAEPTATLKDFVASSFNVCGKITIEKVTIGDTGTFDIDTNIPDGTNAAGTEPSAGDFDLTTTAAGVGGLDSETFIDIQEGNYNVSETVPSGWRLTSMTCSGDDDNGSTVPDLSSAALVEGETGLFVIDLDPGEDITCRFVNEALGTVSADKVVVNFCDGADGDDGLFNLTLDGGATSAINIGNGGSFGPDEVAPGTYVVGETAGTGTSLGDYTVSIGGADCDSSGNVTVSTGEDASCTVTNVRRPTIQIVKEIRDYSGIASDTYDLLIDDGNNNSFDHETEAQGHNGQTSIVTVMTLASGSTTTFGPVKLAETIANGAETLPGAVVIPSTVSGVDDIYWTCDDQAETSGSGSSIVVPLLESGEVVTCTVRNTINKAAACVSP